LNVSSAVKVLFLSLVLMLFGAAAPAAEEALTTRAQIEIQAGLKTAFDAFAVDCGRYPTTSEGFAAMIACPTNIPAARWHGPYFDRIPRDPWGNEYVYRCPGVHNTNGFDSYSCGFDGISKSGGDDLDDINKQRPV
jgi:general secretion pathway protein G